MDAEGVSRIRERVERFLAEDHPERLSDIHDSMRRHPELRSDLRSGRRLTKTQAGIDGSVENLIPVLHLRRARRAPPLRWKRCGTGVGRPAFSLRTSCAHYRSCGGVDVLCFFGQATCTSFRSARQRHSLMR